MTMPRAYANQAEFGTAVSEIERQFQPQIIYVRYSFGNDWTGEPSVFFRVLLSDEASRIERLRNISVQFEDAIEEQLEPREKWGVLPYFNYRSASEQQVI